MTETARSVRRSFCAEMLRDAARTRKIGAGARLTPESPALTAKLSAVAVVGVLAGAAAAWLAAHQEPTGPTEPGAILTLVVGASLLGCGLASWRSRPENRVGPIMVCTGFAWFAAQLNGATVPWIYTIGTAVQSVWGIGLIYLLLSFPSGRLPGRLDRWLLGVAILLVVGFQLLAMLYGNRAGLRCPGCPDNLLQVTYDNQKALDWLNLQRLLGGALIVMLIGVLVRRWINASAAQRRAVAPVLVAGCLSLAALAWTVTFDLLGDPLGAFPANVWFYTMALVPIAVLFVFLQRRLARGMVAGLVVELGGPSASTDLREALSRALGDPSLELAFWFPADKCYVDGDGRAVALPDHGSGRRSTFVERDGQPVALLLHDPVLDHNAELVSSVCAAASLALENERLQAELRARLAELGIPRTAGRGDGRRASTDRARSARRHPAAARLDRNVARTAGDKTPGRRRVGATPRPGDAQGAGPWRSRSSAS